MGFSVITYGNLKLSPYQLTNLLELKIVKKINDHTRLYFTGMVKEGQKDSYVDKTGPGTEIEVTQTGGSSGTIHLFKGIIQNISVRAVRDVYYIEAEALSHTHLLDVKIKSRSFQNKQMSYMDIVKKVISSYRESDVIDTVTKGKKTNSFIMQYNETDWQFIKRLASRFNAGLVPENSSGKPRFYFGIPEGAPKDKLEEFNYTVRKKLADYRISSENHIKGIDENDFIYYEVETDKVLDIGSEVTFKGMSLFVCEIHTNMQKGILKHRYIFAPKKGLSQDEFFNQNITGASVQGRVIQVSKDNVRVHLEIDEQQNPGEAWWFPYSSVYTAEGNSGWYCMPELNDYVRVYFPGFKEEDGVAISSVRKNTEKGETNKLDNPDIKYFRTKSGKELMFSPEEILISAKDGEIFISLNEKDGIKIYSKKPIKIVSKEDIILDSEKRVIISADQEINIKCKESSIKMSGDISILGNHVKTN